MAGKACHAAGSTTRLGLTQALGGGRASQHMDLKAFFQYRFEVARRAMKGGSYDAWQVKACPASLSLLHTSFRPFLAALKSHIEAPWGTVASVRASKSDSFTWDTVWLRFEL